MLLSTRAVAQDEEFAELSGQAKWASDWHVSRQIENRTDFDKRRLTSSLIVRSITKEYFTHHVF
jgi:hypothetical protein